MINFIKIIKYLKYYKKFNTIVINLLILHFFLIFTHYEVSITEG